MLINIRTSYTSYIIFNILIIDFSRQPQRHLDLHLLVIYYSRLLLLCTWYRSYSDLGFTSGIWKWPANLVSCWWISQFLQKKVKKKSGTCTWYTRNMKRPIRYLLIFKQLMVPNSLYIASQFFLAFICDIIRMALFWRVASFLYLFYR